jgi:hypothetical protein
MNEIVISGFNAPEEQRAIEGAISILKTMGMLNKFPKEDCENFVRACAMMKANPILKEVHPVPYWNADLGRNVLGIIPDYKTFLERAERSGKLDGWQTEFEGEVVKKPIVKKAKNRDGTYREYTAEIVDKAKSTLKGRITIWRKDQSHAFVSRWLRLVDEMKDTAFWHDDPDGMLEKNLIREFFAKIFPKDCDLVDYSKEVKVTDYEVFDSVSANETKVKPAPIELAKALKAANDLLQEVQMTHSVREEYSAKISGAYKNGNIGELESIIADLTARKEKAYQAVLNSRKPMPSAEPITEAEVIPMNEELDKARAKVEKAIKTLAKEKIDRFETDARVKESMKKHLAGAESLAACTDLIALETYLEHLRNKYREAKKNPETPEQQARRIVAAIPSGSIDEQGNPDADAERKEQAEACLLEAEQNGEWDFIISTFGDKK